MSPRNDERRIPAVDKKIRRAYMRYIALVLTVMCLFFVALVMLNKFANDRVLGIVHAAKGSGPRSAAPAVVKMEKEIVDTYSTFRTKVLVATIIFAAAFVYLSLRHSYKIVLAFYLLKDTLRRAADGNLSVRLELEEHDQLYDLAEELNLFLKTVQTDYVNKETGTKQRLAAAEPDQKMSRVEEKRTTAFIWKDNPSVAGIAIAVIVLAWLALGFWEPEKPKEMEIEVWAMCTECGERAGMFLHEVPADCPKCGKKKTVYTCYKCRGEESKECGHVFVFVPSPPPTDPYMNLEKWEKMSQEERANAMREADQKVMEYEHARTEAMKCPKCGSCNIGRVHTEEQKKKFQEMRERYLEKKGGEHEREKGVHVN